MKDLDQSLFREDELGTLFDEMMKTVPKDHLQLNNVRV